MSRLLTTSIVAAAALALSVSAEPLASKTFTYTNLPYQADPDDGDRGRQFGYNICNSTTEGPESLCQTAIINSIDDFCLWGAPEPNSLVGNIEGESVAWCTKPGHGTRVIPDGSITGVQFMRTPDYVQVTGFIKQQFINLQADDSGGELDPHGADERGNPLGGLFFSTAWSNDNKTYTQAREWHNFMGGGVFCLKACDPNGPNAAHYCEHIFDRIGCKYNAPAAYVDGVFESCQGDNQDFPGVYTDASGAVQTYQQPPESLGPISTMPYEPKIPASSNCVPFQSANLFAGAPAATGTTGASASGSKSGAPSATAGPSGSSGNSGKTTARSGSPSGTGAPSNSAGAAGRNAPLTSAGMLVAVVVGFVGVAVGAIVA